MEEVILNANHNINAPVSEAVAALNEIDAAAKLVYETIDADNKEKVAAGESPSVPRAKDLAIDSSSYNESERAERVKTYARRAAYQRNKGRHQLERIYEGAMSVEMKLSWNDLTVANSCERFLGICDLAPYTIGRRGPSVLGAKATNTVLEQFAEIVEAYCSAGQSAKREAEILFSLEHDKIMSEDEWITPTYMTSAFSMTINAKNRTTTRIVAGMSSWDEAIRLANVLEWNGKVPASKIADIRGAERKAMFRVFTLATRSLIGLYRGSLITNEAKTSQEKSTPTQSVVPVDTIANT